MKTLAVNLLIICLIITVFPGSGICNVNESSRFNEPDPNTPWPVAFSLGGMNVSHTLMNSYGNPILH